VLKAQHACVFGAQALQGVVTRTYMAQQRQHVVGPPQHSIMLQLHPAFYMALVPPGLLLLLLALVEVVVLLYVQLVGVGVGAVGWRQGQLQVLLPSISCCWVCGCQELQVQSWQAFKHLAEIACEACSIQQCCECERFAEEAPGASHKQSTAFTAVLLKPKPPKSLNCSEPGWAGRSQHPGSLAAHWAACGAHTRISAQCAVSWVW
jgi:hypothetical protein